METCSDDEMFVVNEDHLAGMKEGTHSNPGISCTRESDAKVSFVHLLLFH
jgi:hypothetical protein